MAVRDLAGCMANVRSMLSGLSQWQAICDVDNAADAAERIHYGGVDELATEEDPQVVPPTPAPCVILDIEENDADWIASGLHSDIVIEARFFLECPAAEQATFSSRYLWVWGQASAIEAGINGAVRGGGQLALKRLSYPNKPIQLDPRENHGRDEWLIHHHYTIGLI